MSRFCNAKLPDSTRRAICHQLCDRPYSQSVRMLSLNCHKANYIGHCLLNTLVTDYDLILLQEPWFGKIGRARRDDSASGNPVFGTVSHPDWVCALPCSIDPENPPRVVAYINKKAINGIVTRDDISHRDLMCLEVNDTLVFNVYNDEQNSAVNKLYNTQFDASKVIITGDFNLHHPMWAGDMKPKTEKSEELTNWMSDLGFALINQQGIPTFHRGTENPSVLDLTWVSAEILSRIHDWTIHDGLDFGSDHLPITWHLHINKGLTTPASTKFSFKDERRGEWCTDFQTRASAIRLPRNSCTKEQLGDIITQFSEALVEVSTKHCKSGPRPPDAKPWFTSEVKQAVNDMRKASRKYRQATEKRPVPDLLPFLKERKRTQRFLRRTVMKAKRDWAMKTAEIMAPEEIWKLLTWHKGIRR